MPRGPWAYMSLLAKVAALEATDFRKACGLPPREELASPAAFAAALAVCGKQPEGGSYSRRSNCCNVL